MALTKIDDRGVKYPLDLLDDEQIRFGTGNDLKIWHNGNHSYIQDAGTGNLYIDSVDGDIYIRPNQSEAGISVIENGAIKLHYDNSTKLETTSTGVKVQHTGNAELGVWAGEASNAELHLYADENDDNIDHWKISANGSDSKLNIQNYTGSWETAISGTPNGAVELYYDTSLKLATSADGTSLTGNATVAGTVGPSANATYNLGYNSQRWNDIYMKNDMFINDDGRICWGDGNDLQIYHSGVDSVIDKTTSDGNLLIYVANDFYLKHGTEVMLAAKDDAAVELYYDGVKKFETTSAGVSTTGTSLHTDNIKITVDNGALWVGAGDDLGIYHDGSHSYIKNTTGTLKVLADNFVVNDVDNGDHHLRCLHDGAVELYYDNSKKFETRSGGLGIFGHAELGDNDKVMFGDSNDLQIYHSGSHSYIKDTGTGALNVCASTLYVTNAADSENMIAATENGAVNLYYDGSLRAYTSANGFQVYKASSDDVEFRIVNDQNTTAGATNTILSQHDGRTTAKIVFGRNNDANDFSASAGSTQGDIQFYTTASGTLTQHGKFINTGYLHVCNDGNFVDCATTSHAVRSTGANWSFRAVNSHASTPYGVHAYFNNSNPDTGNYPFFQGQDQTATRFRVQSNGDVENHDNSYGSISDIKLKENIVDAGSQWEDIKAIKVRNFNFKASKSKKKLLGVVAQELETTSPGLVVETPDEDLDHNDLGTTTKSVRYSILYMKAIKALQEAMVRIETLETEVANLKG